MNIKIVHLLSQPEVEREKKSIRDLTEIGLPYKQIINPPYDGEVPVGDSRWINEPIKLGQYGCYLAHKNAIQTEFSDDIDALMVCECDCMVGVDRKIFRELLDSIIDQGSKLNLCCVAIGSFCEVVKKRTELVLCVQRLLSTQSVLYLKKNKNVTNNIFSKAAWCAFDLFLSENFGPIDKLGVTWKRLTSQYTGFSLVTGRKRRVSPKINPEGFSEVVSENYVG